MILNSQIVGIWSTFKSVQYTSYNRTTISTESIISINITEDNVISNNIINISSNLVNNIEAISFYSLP